MINSNIKKLAIQLCVALLIMLQADAQLPSPNTFIIGKGDMPSIDVSKSGEVGVVYGSHDSIMFSPSQNGATFSVPSVIAVLPDLFANAMRGPQIAATSRGFLVTACSTSGDIFSYLQNTIGHWSSPHRVNNAAGRSKEGLMALAADFAEVYAVWLEVKGKAGQQIVGSHSSDGGMHWSKSALIYSSPDSSVCQCCKPSIAIRNQNIYVMFRNWLDGNRDMYLTHSVDHGKTFEAATRLGQQHWKLNGCPMDGGGLALSETGKVETIWRRDAVLYMVIPGHAEDQLAEGRNGSVAFLQDVPIFAWVEKGNIKISKKDCTEFILSPGNMPVLKPLNDHGVICVWVNQGKILTSVIKM